MVTERIINTQKLITAQELAEMGNLGRCELVAGRLVQMSPTSNEHGLYEGNFYFALRSFVDAYHLGKVQVGEVGIYIQRDPDTVRGTDVLFISNERYARQTEPGYLQIAPDLIVEILSPYDRWSEVMQKLRDYFSIGVRLVWVADPRSKSVYAYRAITDVREFGPKDHLFARR